MIAELARICRRRYYSGNESYISGRCRQSSIAAFFSTSGTLPLPLLMGVMFPPSFVCLSVC